MKHHNFLLFISLFTMACQDHQDENIVLKGLIIKTGQTCGWCAGSDSLTLTETKEYYEFIAACGGQNKSLQENTDLEKWNDLLQDFDLETFTNVNVNTCNICVDGCDTWISVQKDDMIHEIRFGDNSPEIEPIRAFVDKLRTLREAFKTN